MNSYLLLLLLLLINVLYTITSSFDCSSDRYFQSKYHIGFCCRDNIYIIPYKPTVY